jgi:hypothetical protein
MGGMMVGEVRLEDVASTGETSRDRTIRWLLCALRDPRFSRSDTATLTAAREFANELLAFLATRPLLGARTESEARSRRIRSYAALMRLVAAVPTSAAYRSALAELGQLHRPSLAKCGPRVSARRDRTPRLACRAGAE